MNDRTCSVFEFLSCTTAPLTGLSCASVTVPATMRSLSSGFLPFWNENTAEANEISSRTANVVLRITLHPPFAFHLLRRMNIDHGYRLKSATSNLLPLRLPRPHLRRHRRSRPRPRLLPHRPPPEARAD